MRRRHVLQALFGGPLLFALRPKATTAQPPVDGPRYTDSEGTADLAAMHDGEFIAIVLYGAT